MEDFFDAVTCYYPINFTPPKNDPIGVQPSQLKALMHECFVASEKMAELFVPFLLEKLAAKGCRAETLEILASMLEKFNSIPSPLLEQITSQVSHLFYQEPSQEEKQMH